MNAETAARIFEPFYTTREKGRGTGMGLVTVKRIVQEAGGMILVDTVPGKGTRMTVRLPQIEPNQNAKRVATGLISAKGSPGPVPIPKPR